MSLANKKGLVLEGGGIRGIYTAGVLDVFLENDINVDGVIGVSAGAIHGASFVSRQKGRSLRYSLKYRNNKEYMSISSLVKTGDLFGADFCYHRLPEELDKYDYDAFLQNPTRLYVCCTNVETGEPEYLECTDMKTDMEKIRASASMPLVSRIVEIDGKKLLDGGTSDSIPIFQFRRMGYRKNIVVLTRPEGYTKKKDSLIRLEAIKYKDYPEYVKRAAMRHLYYNKTLEKLQELEERGEVIIIRPGIAIDISRTERDDKKIQAMYDLGVYDAKNRIEEIKAFLE